MPARKKLKPRAKANKKENKSVLSASVSKKKTSSKKSNFNLATLTKYEKPAALGALAIGVVALLYLFVQWSVVAWVDNMPVTRFQMYNQLESRYGSEIKEQLITEKLVLSEASKRNLSVTNDEMSAEYKKVQDQVGADMLGNLLKQQNISDADFRKQLRLQLLVRKMFGNDVKVTDADINKYIADNKTGDTTPVVDAKQKAQIVDQLTQQKISDNFRKWLQDTEKSSRVSRK